MGEGEFPYPRSFSLPLATECFHGAEVAGGDSECFMRCPRGDSGDTEVFLALREPWGCPIPARDAGAGPWAVL